MVRSSSLKGTTKFLRKHRKWPLSPYKAKWHQTFNQQQAMQTLQQAARTPTPPLSQPQNPNKPWILSSLTHAFSIYNCDPTPEAYHFVIRTLTKTSHFHHIPPVLDHLEQVERFETPEYIFADLIKLYGDANKVQEAIDLFCRIPKFRCVPSVYSLNTLLSVLCRNREGLKMIPQVWLNSQIMNIRVEESSFRVLITALCRIKKAGYAIEILNYMVTGGYSVDVRMCSSILCSLCEQKDLSCVKVMGFMEELRKFGFCPGKVDYTTVIRFLVKRGRGMDALNVLNQMKSDGIKPDIVCYTMVLCGVIAERDYKKADELFDELLVLGLVPDIYTYNVYINGLCKQYNVEAGITMVACMEQLGCRPNLITYNTLLEALCEDGELTRSKELVREMGSKGIELNLQTYRIMIDGLVRKGEIFEACGLLEEVLDKCFCPQNVNFDEIICGLCHRGLVCKVLELIKKMVDRNVSPGATAWKALLSLEPKISFGETTLICLVDPIQNHLVQLPDSNFGQ